MRFPCLRAAMAGITLGLSCTGVHAADQASAAAPAVSAPASASAPSRGGAPRPYQAPIQVPSAAGRIESPSLPAPVIGITPVAPPTFSGQCDSTGGWGSDGTRYNAVGGALVRPDGRMCQIVGGVMQCP